MAGYVFNLNSRDALSQCAKQGVYGTIFKSDPTGTWATAHEATFGDYCSMRPGDSVYFFHDRRVYGIGNLVRVGEDCRYQNFLGATGNPRAVDPRVVQTSLLLKEAEIPTRQRWICLFAPDPYFFTNGVDMDDLLTYRPASFRVLRAMWQRSFVRIDDEEDQALRDVVLRANRDALAQPVVGRLVLEDDHQKVHSTLEARLTKEHHLQPESMMNLCARADGRLRHEMAIEAGIVFQLAERRPDTTRIFGSWDYVSHQVTASPPKPPMYIDHMDIFGLTYLSGRTLSHYSIIEVKKDEALDPDLQQTMKYVDWVKDEYCFGDYSMVRAYLVAWDFPQSVVAAIADGSANVYGGPPSR